MANPKIAFDGHMWKPQPISDPRAAVMALEETAWTLVAYSLAQTDNFIVYNREGEERVPKLRLYNDALDLALGLLTIKVPHDECRRLICNCKIQ